MVATPTNRTQKDMEQMSSSDPSRRAQLKNRNPINWHVKKPDQGPASLAVKNRKYLTSLTAKSLRRSADFIAMIGEYVGTVLFMIFALGGTK